MNNFILVISVVLTLILLFMCKEKCKNEDNKRKIQNIVLFTLIVTVVLETFTFNFKAYTSFGKDYESKQVSINTYDTSKNTNVSYNQKIEGNDTEKKKIYTFEWKNIDSKVKTIRLIPESISNKIKCDISYIDDAFNSYHQVAKGSMNLLGKDCNENHFSIKAAGNIKSLKIVLTTDSDISKLDIKLNTSPKFIVNIPRMIVTWILLFVAMLLVVYRGSKEIIFGRNKITKISFITFTIVEIIIAVIFTIEFNSDSATTPTTVDFGDVVLQNEAAAYNDPYNEMSMAFSKGQLNLNGLNPLTIESEKNSLSQLSKLDNPYKADSRLGIEYKWDHAFYNGNYYSYFGVVPELVAYLPVYIITGQFLSTKFFTFVLMILSIILMSLLVYELAASWEKKINIPIVLSLAATMINGTMLYCAVTGGKFYEVATFMALAFALLGIYLALISCRNKKINLVAIGFSALAFALSIGCRPNYILVIAIFATIVIPALIKQSNQKGNWFRKIFNKNNLKTIIAIVLPFLVVGIGLMIYNYARFGSITEFGAKYQLTVYDTSYYSSLDFSKLPLVIGQCLLMIPVFSNKFPFVGSVEYSANYIGYNYQMSYMGAFSNPILWIMSFLPWAVRKGRMENKWKAFTVTTSILAFVMCYITTTVGGISLRYSVDYLWIFFLAVIPVAFAIYNAGVKKHLGSYITVIITVMAFVTVLINLGVMLNSPATGFSKNNPEFLTWLENTVIFWRM